LNTTVLEQTEHGEVPLDVYQKLANDRILFLSGYISTEMAMDITATLLLKDFENPDQKISLFINSDGGNIRDILMIYDMMNLITAPIETVCIGSTFNEAVILLAAGEPGMRLATKNSFISVGTLGHDWSAHVDVVNLKKIIKMSDEDNKRMMQIFADSTGKPLKQVSEDFQRSVFMNSTKALKYGFIDKIISFNK